MQQVPRKDVERLTGESAEPIDALAPMGWRCYAAIESQRVISHAFVEARADGPFLFRAFTEPDRRGEGIFSALTSFIASEARGRALASSTRASNTRSLRAHRAAGFVVMRRRMRIFLFGLELQQLPSALRARLAGVLPRRNQHPS
jgi:GNAT superfamily N-acetyltransferase